MGVMAQEVLGTKPEAVGLGMLNGEPVLGVDYGQL